MLTTLLVEDDLDLAATLIDYLALEDIQCDHASHGHAALSLLATNPYQVIILDLNLPRMDGIAVCEALRNKGMDTPVIMLTARDTLEDKLQGFNAGTDDYLVKPFALSELVVRLHALSKRRSGQTQKLSLGGLEMRLAERQVCREQQVIKLSPTGFKLLEVLLRASPAPVSRQELIQAIWGESPPDSNSLKVHMHHLRKQVDGPFEEKLIHTLPGFGFTASLQEDINENQN